MKKLKYFEVRWYHAGTGQYLGEQRVLPEHYNNDIDFFRREVEDALRDRLEELDVKFMEVYQDGSVKQL